MTTANTTQRSDQVGAMQMSSHDWSEALRLG
ncbi:hypothetical protein JNB_12873 [Janibacter sp. HTCC2649]|nr:hypothetical protein JNB_12873 [Janibacter sp. HTCC2649]